MGASCGALEVSVKKFLVPVAALACLLAVATPATAEFGTIDAVPGASLLLPHFEVDLDQAGGITTLFSVNNASATAILAHVTIWSNWTVPIIDFDIYLTGYDVQTVNLYDIFVNGNLPRTASAGQDPGDTISNQGAFSQDINFASCTGFLPYAQLSSSFRTQIQESHPGRPQSLGAGARLSASRAQTGDTTLATGYITVDTVNQCSQEFPSSPGYFAFGAGIATNQNVLWGDYFIVDSVENFAQGWNLVHLEANPLQSTPCVVDGTPQTFYCRYSLGADQREALGSKYAVRYLNGGAFTGGTSLLSYRDQGQVGSLRSCAGGPLWEPLSQAEITIFDEQENPITVVSGGPSGEPVPGEERPFPLESNRTVVGLDLTTGSFSFGWAFLNLNGADTGADAEKTQAYVVATMDASGRFSVGIDAIQLNNLTVADLGPASLVP